MGIPSLLPLLCLAALCSSCANGSSASMKEPTLDSPATKAHPELGLVRWERDFSKAVARSKKSARPILLLFQEVPG